MGNVQLGEREAVRVFLEYPSKRILGMAPSSIMAPLLPGLRFTSEVLLHSWEIESWLKKWREQQKYEAILRTEVQAQRDSVFRNSIAAQIRSRNQHVDPWNRDENNRLLQKMDADYDTKLKKQMNPQLYGVAESSEASKSADEIALDSPYFKHGPERVAQGERIDPKDAA